ncbi:MAG: hypothetical protein M3N16_00455 [Actinomycetota bacterium]|nr:hypothetical protein [Actinomycetota bacterium]
MRGLTLPPISGQRMTRTLWGVTISTSRSERRRTKAVPCIRVVSGIVR